MSAGFRTTSCSAESQPVQQRCHFLPASHRNSEGYALSRLSFKNLELGTRRHRDADFSYESHRVCKFYTTGDKEYRGASEKSGRRWAFCWPKDQDDFYATKRNHPAVVCFGEQCAVQFSFTVGSRFRSLSIVPCLFSWCFPHSMTCLTGSVSFLLAHTERSGHSSWSKVASSSTAGRSEA